MTPQPELKVNDLIQRLSMLAAKARNGSVDALSIRRVETEALALLKSDALGGNMALGIASAIKGDEAKSREYHLRAIRLSDDEITRRNYANSLCHMGKWDDAFEQFDIVVERCPDDVALFKYLLEWSIRTGCPQRAIVYGRKVLKLDPSARNDENLTNFMKAADVLAKSGLCDADISAIDALASQVVKEFGAEVFDLETWEDSWENPDASVVRFYRVRGGDVADMNWALAELKAAANTDALRSGRYYVGFSVAPDQ